jgi:hypothetical protein
MSENTGYFVEDCELANDAQNLAKMGSRVISRQTAVDCQHPEAGRRIACRADRHASRLDIEVRELRGEAMADSARGLPLQSLPDLTGLQADTRLHRHPQADRRVACQIWPVNAGLAHSGLLWAAYLFCLLLSGVQSPYPATGLTTHVANTAASGDTFINPSVVVYCAPPVNTTIFPGFRRLHSIVSNSLPTLNIRVFTSDMTTRVKISSGSGFYGLIIKDSLTLGAGSLSTTAWKFYSLTVSGALLTSAQISTGSGLSKAKYIVDVPSSNQVVAVSDTGIQNINSVDGLSSTHTLFSPAPDVGSGSISLHAVTKQDAYFAACYNVTHYLFARANFATIKNPTFAGISGFNLLDNISGDYFFIYTSTEAIKRYTLSTWITEADVFGTMPNGVAYGFKNHMMNFGPYQYVVTMTQNTPTYALFFKKLTMVITDTTLTIAGVNTYNRSPHYGDLQNDNDKFDILLFNTGNKNFQSYYLTVADCTSRDASNICQTCTAGNLRTSPFAHNLCAPLADYPGYQLDTVNNFISMCPGLNPIGTGCLAITCATGFTTCTVCDVANSYYLLNGACYHYNSIPDGYGIVTAGLQALGACTDTNCLKCVASRATCTQCKDATGYYWYTTTSLCVHTSAIVNGLGANLVTLVYETCSKTNCLDCAVNKAVCTKCNDVAGYYKETVSGNCVLTSAIADGLGANLATFVYETCTKTNCLDCAVNKAVCTKCNDVAGYYKETVSGNCILTSAIADGLGANLATFVYETCTKTNCLDCAVNKAVCTKCNDVAGYYKETVSGNCVLTSAIADGLGANLITFVYETCTLANCVKCATNKATCGRCNNAAGFYYNAGTTSCVLTSAIADGLGANLITFVYETCTKSNCLKCAVDKTVCTKCNDVAGYYKETVSGNCILTSAITDGFGANLVTFVYETCTLANCLKCASDKGTCNKCNDTAGFYYNAGTASCVHTSAIADGLGANLITFVYETCTLANCVKCATNKATCGRCNNAAGFYYNAGTTSCVHTSAIANGQGPNLVSLVIEPCVTANCIICNIDRASCTKCNDAAGFFKDTSTNTCVHTSAIGLGRGANLGNFLYENCIDSGCGKCATDKTICTRCSDQSGYYMNTTVTLCQHYSTVLIGYGANLVTFVYEICLVPGCGLCATDNSRCQRCNDLIGFYVDPIINACVHTSAINSGRGANLVTFMYENCSHPSCTECSVDRSVCTACGTVNYALNGSTCIYTGKCADANCKACAYAPNNCTECDQANGYILVNGSCDKKLTQTSDMLVIKNEFIETSKRWLLVFNSTITIERPCRSLNVTVVDGSSGKTYSCDEIGCEIVDITSNGFSIRFNSQYSISYGTASLNKDQCLNIKSSIVKSSSNFDRYPVERKIGIIGPAPITTEIADYMSTSMRVSALSMNFIALPFNRDKAFKLDLILNSFLLLLVLRGNDVYWPQSILDMMTKWTKFATRNKFRQWAASARCDVPDSFSRNDLVCSIFGNYGEDLIVLMVTLAISIFVFTLVVGLMCSKKIQESKLKKALLSLKDSYGMTFVICKLEANKFALMLFSVYNLKKSYSNDAMIIGDVLGCVLILWYTYSISVQFYLSFWTWRQLKQSNNTSPKIEQKSKEDIEKKKFEFGSKTSKSDEDKLADRVDFSMAPSFALYLTVLLKGCNIPTRFHQLLLGPLVSLKSMIVAVIVIFLAGSPIAQVAIVLCLELPFYVFQSMCNIKVSLSLRITDVLTGLLLVSYIALKLVANFDSLDDRTRQGNLAMIMVVCVYGIIIVSISFALFSLILILFQLCKRATQWIRNKTAPQVSDQLMNSPQSKNGAPEKKRVGSWRVARRSILGSLGNKKDATDRKLVDLMDNVANNPKFIKTIKPLNSGNSMKIKVKGPERRAVSRLSIVVARSDSRIGQDKPPGAIIMKGKQ